MLYQMTYAAMHAMERARLAVERRKGVPFDYFIALSNLARELAPLQNSRAVEDVWLEYRVNQKISDVYRERPDLFPGFDRVVGLENLMDRLNEGGVIVTLHYAEYRHAVRAVGQSIRKVSRTIPLRVVADTDSSRREPPKWLRLMEENDCSLLIAENQQVGMKLFRHLREGGWFFLYLDGNTGAGTDSNPLETRFLSSRITARSGVLRLLARAGKPIIVMLAEHINGKYQLTIHPPFSVSSDSLEQGLENCYRLFRGPLTAHPELWRFWYRHHRQVKEWHTMPQHAGQPSRLDWKCQNSSPTLALEVATGHVFRMGSN